MARRSEKRDEAKAEYCARRAKGEKVNLKEMAESMAVSYDLLRRWKSQDEWEAAVPRKRGGQPGNKNSKARRTPRETGEAHQKETGTRKKMGLTAPSFLMR